MVLCVVVEGYRRRFARVSRRFARRGIDVVLCLCCVCVIFIL